MPTVKLTDRGVQGLSTDKDRETYWDTLVEGFGVRVSGKTGRKSFFVRYRANGSHRRMTLGKYPRLSLADARDQARDALAAAQAGEDPALEREERKSTDATFKALAREVLDAKADQTREATRTERERMLEKDLLPAWGSRPAASISRREVLHLVEGIVDRGSPVAANRTLRLIQLIFNEGLRRGFPTLEGNPAAMMELPGKEGRRRRFLSRKEIRAVWKALEPEAPHTRAVFRLALLTAQRIGAVCALRWEDIDAADVWRIPEDTFKGKRPHLVPLSSEALAVLDDLPNRGDGEYAFPARSDAETPHMSSTGPALRRVRDRTTIEHWTAHDFRRTFRTWASRPAEPDHPADPAGLGVAPEIADAVLGHKEQSIGFEHYQGEPERYRLSEKREALRRWGRFVARAVREET